MTGPREDRGERRRGKGREKRREKGGTLGGSEESNSRLRGARKSGWVKGVCFRQREHTLYTCIITICEIIGRCKIATTYAASSFQGLRSAAGGQDVVLGAGGTLFRGAFRLEGEASGEDGSMYGSAMELRLYDTGLVQVLQDSG